ncbi:hypothetical protein PHAVU_011G096900 [Phaseolus vulgaris]|uniref:Uncharacterized protein n=1 Tax=Phaseolus vulgaris TaxID=3885 RepID=V7AK30_PHAVU|nr:hypothetical protein PHAVU_011G096900g [Phaseolus vulgaris]ESW04466.1 hypothetical protein PHAVU_011G096900g [Phaseolus vulgaris]
MTLFLGSETVASSSISHMVVASVSVAERKLDKEFSVLLSSIFQNTSSEVVKENDGNTTILGIPTESTLLEFGLLSDGDFDAQRATYKILKVEPFNSFRKKMSVLAKNVSDIINGFASEALRTLCLAAKDVNESLGETSIPEDGYTLIVIVGIKDPVRPGVKICSNLLSCWNNCPHGYR